MMNLPISWTLTVPAALLVPLSLLAGCGGQSDDESQPLARPVTLITLEEGAPPPSKLIPGLVRSYREVEVPFEVGGRVQAMIEVGDEVVGEQRDGAGAIVQAGTVLAMLDPAPLQRALNRSEQRLLSARKELEAQVVQLEKVLPAQLESARSRAAAAELNATYAKENVDALDAAVELARTTLKRNRDLLPGGAVSDMTVRQSEAELQTQRSRQAQSRTLVTTREREHDAANAAIAEVEGAIALQQAGNASRAASIEELHEAVRQAESDLENCTLRAPFQGRVTATHVGEGSFVAAGAPIVTLTMMNPVEAVISVSARTADDLLVGTDAMIYPATDGAVDFDRAVQATVYEKRGVADLGTRTFEVGLIAPNRRRNARSERGEKASVPYVIPLFDNPLDLPSGGGLYTVADAIGRDDTGAWVLVVEGLTQGNRNAESLRGELQARRVPVKVSSNVIKVASFSLVKVEANGSLKTGDLLLPFPTPEHEAGFYVDDNRWLLRPGELVHVAAVHGALPDGIYVPVQAIRERNGRTQVFVVDDASIAHAVTVDVMESSGELRRAVSDELRAGQRIVKQGVHFLQDGDLVAPSGVSR